MISLCHPAGGDVRVAAVEWPDGLCASDPVWEDIIRQIEEAGPDILVTNELPFGEWLAGRATFDAAAAQRSVEAHQVGLAALARTSVPVVITSRPIWAGLRLVNEVVVIERGQVQPLRRKRNFADERGWHERTWFAPGDPVDPLVDIAGLKVGVLLGTEAMFTERARALGRAGADLIAVPRASGPSPVWTTAAAMAAIASGSYVVSSNRAGGSLLGQAFSGGALAYAPTGTLIGRQEGRGELLNIRIDRQKARRQKRLYPCYVAPDHHPAATPRQLPRYG